MQVRSHRPAAAWSECSMQHVCSRARVYTSMQRARPTSHSVHAAKITTAQHDSMCKWCMLEGSNRCNRHELPRQRAM
eukprot:6699452-Alexandrium_andersonii.AAC.1